MPVKINIGKILKIMDFDRIIVPQAKFSDLALISKDERINKNYFGTKYQ